MAILSKILCVTVLCFPSWAIGAEDSPTNSRLEGMRGVLTYSPDIDAKILAERSAYIQGVFIAAAIATAYGIYQVWLEASIMDEHY